MGCFAQGTPVKIPNGHTPIETIRVGDLVVRPEGPKEFADAEVREVFQSEEELISLVTGHRTILTTWDQLFRCHDGKDRKTGELMSQYVGYLLDDKELVYIKVLAVIPKGVRAKVFHLHVEEPNLYFCGGFLVHNKGGGGGTSTTENTIAPELRPLFKQTGEEILRLQPGILDSFIQPQVQFIPQASSGQMAILRRQRERAGLPQPDNLPGKGGFNPSQQNSFGPDTDFLNMLLGTLSGPPGFVTSPLPGPVRPAAPIVPPVLPPPARPEPRERERRDRVRSRD